MSEKVVLEHDDLRRTLRRIAHEIAEKNPEPEGFAIVGIHTRGAVLARRLHALVGALIEYGRPARVQLAVLCDRGHRELPFRPDYVGKNLPTSREERVNVRLEEVDGLDQVTISEPLLVEVMS